MALFWYYYCYLRTWVSWERFQEDLPVVHYHHIPEGHHCCLNNTSKTEIELLHHMLKSLRKWGTGTGTEGKRFGFHLWSDLQQSHQSCSANIPAVHRSHTAECHYYMSYWQHYKRIGLVWAHLSTYYTLKNKIPVIKVKYLICAENKGNH